MTTKHKRSYYMPDKLIDLLEAECQKSGLVREKVIAAAALHFLKSGPEARADMFEELNKEISRKK
jgi:hypothetical protein